MKIIGMPIVQNPIQDHNDRVAHSDDRFAGPEDNAPEFTKNDFYIPELVGLKCWQCGDLLDNCDICKEPFDLEDRNEVGCGQFPNKSGNNGHICTACWEDLPDGTHDIPEGPEGGQ